MEQGWWYHILAANFSTASLHQLLWIPYGKNSNLYVSDACPIYQQNRKPNAKPWISSCISPTEMSHKCITSLCDESGSVTKIRITVELALWSKSQLLLTISDLEVNISNGGQTDALMFDLSNVFDKVPHDKLQNYMYSISGNTLEWLKNFLTDKSKKVLIKLMVNAATQPESPPRHHLGHYITNFSQINHKKY